MGMNLLSESATHEFGIEDLRRHDLASFHEAILVRPVIGDGPLPKVSGFHVLAAVLENLSQCIERLLAELTFAPIGDAIKACVAANNSPPAATATSHQASRIEPTDSAMPVNRCRIDRTDVI